MISFSDLQNEVNKICLNANNLALYIRQGTGIDSKLVYYEEIFFFYFLNNVALSIKEAPVELTTRIQPLLLKVLSHTDSPEYKEFGEYMDIFIAFRFKQYFNLMCKYSEKITPDFLSDAFQYQAELIVYIQENNCFMDPKQIPSPIPVWIQKAAKDDYLVLINKILNDHADMILDFLND